MVAGLMEKSFAAMPNPPTVVLALLATAVASLPLEAERSAATASGSSAARATGENRSNV